MSRRKRSLFFLTELPTVWLTRWRTGRRASPRPSPRSLHVEALEGRVVLAADLTGTIWQDQNGDGLQSVGELGVQSAVAELFTSTNAVVGDADDVSIGTRITDAAGNYQFTGLAAGTNYYLVVRTPAGLAFTTQDAGGNDALDSDVSATTGRSSMFAPIEGQVVDLDAGLTGTSANFGWATKAAGTGGSNQANDVAVDTAGNSYVAGSFTGVVDFDNGVGVYQLTSSGSRDGYIAKYTAQGSLVWARALGGTGSETGTGVALDSSGNVAVTGYLQHGNTFVWKFDGAGNLAWTKTISASQIEGHAIAFDPGDNILVSGFFQGTADFGDGVVLTSSASLDAFVWKLDAGGTSLWARKVDAPLSTDDATGVAVDQSGNVYVSGTFSGVADFDPGAGTATRTSAGSSDAFLWKLDASGNLVWAVQAGGQSVMAEGFDVALDSQGDVVAMGRFVFGAIDFDPGPGTATLTSQNAETVFVWKLDHNGNFVWVRQASGTSNVFGEGKLAIDSTDNVYVSGMFGGSATFGIPGPTMSQTSLGDRDAFVWKMDVAGNIVWAYEAGGWYFDAARAVAVDAAGNVVFVGTFTDSAYFAPGPPGTNPLTNSGSSAIFAARWNASFLVPDIAVKGNGQVIASGDSTPSASDNTDFGQPTNVTGTVTRTFSIENTGLAALALRGTPRVEISGAHAADFSVSLLPADRVNPSGLTTFQITFDPSAIGLRTATVTIRNDDPDESVYTFAVQGTGYTADVTGRVWNDQNGDGRQSVGEAGVAGTVVELIDSVDGVAGNGNDVSLGTVLTDAQGNYQFAGLAYPASYFVAIRTPAGPAFTTRDVRADDAVDSDFDALTGRSSIFTPGAGQTVDLDAGLTGTSPGFGFAARYGTSGADAGRSVIFDAAGNLYVAGEFTGTVDFDVGAGNYSLTSAGGSDAFVAKYSAAGALVWARRLGGTGTENFGNASPYGNRQLAIDSTGNLYVGLAYASASVDADPGPGVVTVNRIGSSTNTLLVKLDTAGNYVWSRNLGGTSNTRAAAIAVDAAGNLYATGYFQGTTDFDPGPGDASLTASLRDVFVTKFSTFGDCLWARRVGGVGEDDAYGLAVDSAGNAIVTGAFTGTVDFDPGGGTSELVSAGTVDIFVLKLNAAGDYLWSQRAGSTFSDRGVGVAVDGGDNVIITGHFVGVVDFDPDVGTLNLTSSSTEGFVWKLSGDGRLVWVRQLGDLAVDGGYAVAVDTIGNVTIAGTFQRSPDFDPGPGTFTLTSQGGDDAFVWSLDANGDFRWARSVGGTSTDFALSVALGPQGDVAFTGFFNSAVDFDHGLGTYNLVGVGGDDAYVSYWRALPSIVLSGNGRSIAAGDATPTATDDTDFGQVLVAGGLLTHTFTVANTGLGVLNLTGSPRVQVSGANAGDFTVTLLPPASVDPGRPAAFQITFDPSAAGLRTAVVTIESDDADQATYTFAIQGTGNLAPIVTGAYARGTTWSTAYLTYLAGQGLGDATMGYALATGAGQLTPLPWANLDQLSLRFSEAVTVTAGDLLLVGSVEGAAPPSTSGFSYDSASFTATWTFASSLSADKYLLHLDDVVADVAGAGLDGEWTTGVSTASGDGTAGGDLDFRFNVLPGDFDGSGSVTFGEIGQARLQLGATASTAGFNHRQDFDGTGSITFGDVGQARLKLGATLSAFSEPVAPGSGPQAVAVQLPPPILDGNTEFVFPLTPLTSDQLSPIVTEAVARWRASGLVPAGTDFAAIRFEIRDLGPAYLGLGAANNVILLDDDGAGWGWFADATPAADAEFGEPSGTQSSALAGSAAEGRIDLLTVVMHEIGHVLGYPTGGATGTTAETLMTKFLGTGVRRTAAGPSSIDPSSIDPSSIGPPSIGPPAGESEPAESTSLVSDGVDLRPVESGQVAAALHEFAIESARWEITRPATLSLESEFTAPAFAGGPPSGTYLAMVSRLEPPSPITPVTMSPVTTRHVAAPAPPIPPDAALRQAIAAWVPRNQWDPSGDIEAAFAASIASRRTKAAASSKLVVS